MLFAHKIYTVEVFAPMTVSGLLLKSGPFAYVFKWLTLPGTVVAQQLEMYQGFLGQEQAEMLNNWEFLGGAELLVVWRCLLLVHILWLGIW